MCHARLLKTKLLKTQGSEGKRSSKSGCPETRGLMFHQIGTELQIHGKEKWFGKVNSPQCGCFSAL